MNKTHNRLHSHHPKQQLILPQHHKLWKQEQQERQKETKVNIRKHWEIDACNETNLMHHLSSVYSVTITLHVSGLLLAPH
jgi:hypothetical protein